MLGTLGMHSGLELPTHTKVRRTIFLFGQYGRILLKKFYDTYVIGQVQALVSMFDISTRLYSIIFTKMTGAYCIVQRTSVYLQSEILAELVNNKFR